MVLLGLLVLALVCLGMGLVLTSAPWLIGSLIASAGAGFLVWRTGTAMARQAKRSPLTGEHEALDTTDEPEAADAGMTAGTVISGGAAAVDTATVSGAASPDGTDTEVWVIDGRPRYHREDCAIIKGQEAEPIPFDQATEDGFMPCSLCEPNAARATSTSTSTTN